MLTLEQQIRRLLSVGAVEDALALAELAVVDERLHAVGLVWSALSRQRQRRFSLALRSSHRLVSLRPVPAAVLTLHGRLLNALREPLLALEFLRQAVEDGPDDRAANLSLLTSLSALGQGQAARKHARWMLGRFHDDAAAHAALRLVRRRDELQFGVAWLHADEVRGWIRDRRPLGDAVRLVVSAGGILSPLIVPRRDSAAFARRAPAEAHGFRFPWPGNASSLSIRFADSERVLEGCPLRRPPRQVEASAPAALVPGPEARADVSAHHDSRVDVIIPVYRGYAATKRCLLAVLECRCATRFDVIVFDDATPEPDIKTLLKTLAASGAIHLFTNAENLGFLRTINRALSLHPERDCVLLNADTVVSGDWLDRLRAAAYRAEEIASATPLSNNGEIMSHPVPAAVNPLPSDAELRTLDRTAAAVNADLSITVPTGVGFCLYLKRRCLDEVGFLDEQFLHRGYGEEADLCLRASAKGWRHVCAANVFVGHAGTVSFGREKRDLVLRNAKVLEARYPHYGANIDRFIRQDPLRGARARIERARLQHCPSAGRLLVAGGRGRRDPRLKSLRFDCAAGGEPIYWLRIERTKSGRCLRLEGDSRHVLANLEYRLDQDLALLAADLRSLRLRRIELHETASLAESLMNLLVGLGIPYALVPHDYALYCPRRFLLQADNDYCDDPLDERRCEQCLAAGGTRVAQFTTLAMHRARSQQLLQGAEEIRLPSVAAVRRFERRFAGVLFRVEAPADRMAAYCASSGSAAAIESVHVVAVVGAVDDASGFRHLLQMARCAAAQDLPLLFLLTQPSQDDLALYRTAKVVVAAVPDDEHFVRWLAVHACCAVLALAAWPDPDASAMALAMKSGLPVVALGWPESRAFAGTDLDACWLDPDAAPTEWTATLAEFASRLDAVA